MKSEIIYENGNWALLVNDQPFTMLSGETHNSSACSATYMEEMVWPKIRELNLNSLLLPVTWEQIEPVEGIFDFTILDEMIQQSCREHIKLGILWFGLWKNGISSYIPNWMKKDEQQRFFRACDRYGKKMDVISPFCKEAVLADARAFSALMEHIEERNKTAEAVIIIQVENEIGLLGSDRDYSPQAEVLFTQPIPAELEELYQVKGTWQQSFGDKAPEIFMTYGYALALHQITMAGRKHTALPMFVNAWLEKFPWRAGGYPSGGPIAKYMELWKTIAPELAVLAPDVYTTDFSAVCGEYITNHNPLLIPEHRRDLKNISNLLYAFSCNALCFSIFGIEDLTMLPEEKKGIADPQVMAILNIDQSAWNCEGSAAFLKAAYGILGNMTGFLSEHRTKRKVHGYIRRNDHEKGTVISLKTCDIRLDFIDKGENQPKAAGIIIESGDHECIILGVSSRITILPRQNETRELGILNYLEGSFMHDQFKVSRNLNGDERYCMIQREIPEVHKVEWYYY